MRKASFCTAAAIVVLAFASPAMALPSFTGDINFDGSDTYNATSVTFIGSQGVSSGTGSFTAFGTCASCITAKNITYSPFVGPLDNFLAGTNAGVHFALDVNSVFNVQFVPNNDLDFDSAAVLHLTGFADTPGTLFFSSQGPNDLEVSFSATAVAAPEPASLAVLGLGLLGLGFVRPRRQV